MKADRNAIEQAYAFFHQKLKVYERSTSEREMDHIEDCIANYANSMSKELFEELSQGNPAFLHEHTTFQEDLTKAARLCFSLPQRGNRPINLNPSSQTYEENDTFPLLLAYQPDRIRTGASSADAGVV